MIDSIFRGLRRRLDTAEPRMPQEVPLSAKSVDGVRDPLDKQVSRVKGLLAARRMDEALALAQAITARFPQSPQAHWCLGRSLLAADSAEPALHAYSRALDLKPDHVPSLIGQAKCSQALGRTEDAVDSLEIALAHDPRAVEALLDLAGLYEEADEWPRVVGLIERALEVEPSRADLWLRMALARDGCEQFDAAVLACERALAIDPNSVGAWVNMGMIHLERLGEPHRAELCFRKALSLDAHCQAAQADLGLALQEQGKFEAALTWYDEAIARSSDGVEFRWNRALARLMTRQFETAWDDYEWRFKRESGRAQRNFPFPPWRGEAEVDGALLVYAEQGLGDEIMFASCLPDLEERNVAVVLECNPRLETLFSRSFPRMEIRGKPRNNDRTWLADHPGVSRQIPIGSLPRFLRPSASCFPSRRGYLMADPVRVRKWREQVNARGHGLKVGLVWRGGTPKTRRSLKSTTLQTLLPLLDVPGTQYVCMQHDMRAEEHELILAHHDRMVFWSNALTDIEETAALTASLDLTISVAATGGHLAGALGCPVWIMLSASPEWRWFWEGETTPWYPSARLWRQRRPGDWAGIVRELSQGLKTLQNSRSQHPDDAAF